MARAREHRGSPGCDRVQSPYILGIEGGRLGAENLKYRLNSSALGNGNNRGGENADLIGAVEPEGRAVYRRAGLEAASGIALLAEPHAGACQPFQLMTLNGADSGAVALGNTLRALNDERQRGVQWNRSRLCHRACGDRARHRISMHEIGGAGEAQG